MPNFQHQPPLPPGRSAGPFAQTITLLDQGQTLGSALWHTPGPDGVIQLVHIQVAPAHQRRGVGQQLLREVIAQAQLLFKSRKTRLRRLWAALLHKDHIIARAFLTTHGLHHTSTIENLFKDQELLIYVRTFD